MHLLCEYKLKNDGTVKTRYSEKHTGNSIELFNLVLKIYSNSFQILGKFRQKLHIFNIKLSVAFRSYILYNLISY